MVSKDGSEPLADAPATAPVTETPAVAAAAPSPAQTWLSEGQEFLVIVGLLALCLSIRLLWLQRIEIADDMVIKWHFVRQWFHPHDFRHAAWNHHMTRMGVNVPVFFVQALTGASARSYYAVQLLSFAAQVLLAFFLGRRLAGRGAALIAAVFLCLFTGVNRDVSQLLPDGIGGTAALLTFYLLVRYQEASDAMRLRWLAASGLAFIWTYLVKESNLLMLPGFSLAVLICRRNLRDALLFTAIPILGLLLETGAYRVFTDFSSRFAVVQEAKYEVPVTFFGMFDRFTKLEPAWQMVFWMWLASSFALLPRSDRRVQAMLVVPAGFIFLFTFLVRSINPLLLWTAFRSRYFSAVLPFLVLSFALVAADALGRGWKLHVPQPFRDWPARLSPYWGFFSFALFAFIGGVAYLQARPTLPNHPFREIATISRVVNDAYRRNLPIVQGYKSQKLEEARARGLKAVYGIYLQDKYIAQSDQAKAKGGRLPDILEAVHRQRLGSQNDYAYLLRDQRAYGNVRRVRELDDDGCAVRILLDTRSFFSVAPELLPERCKAPSGEPIPR